MPASNQVRISAGEWRSRVLSFPDVEGLRPTPDRVRQTLFNWLGQELFGLCCLDLFAGTGVMGFEALSRGAEHVVMIEKSKLAFQALLKNQAALKANKAQILNIDALQYIAQVNQKFDVIFLDPPYQQGWIDKVLPSLISLLNPNGLLYVEAEYAITDSAHWQVQKHGKAGNVFYHLLATA